MQRGLVLIWAMVQWFACIVNGQLGQSAAMEKLKKYGYIGSTNPLLGAMTDERAYPAALMEYQWNMGLKTTGKLDADTSKMLVTPRCGVQDVKAMSDIARRRKRYALSGGKWKTNPISYRETSYTRNLPESTIRRVIDEALQVWSSVAKIDFERRTSGKVDMELKFTRRDHQDGNPFDGRSGTLAHAYFPHNGAPIEGDAHFDDDETWTDKTYQGTNLFQVAVHEFGHSLGLQHSRERSAIMYPSYLGYKPDFKLGTDDVQAIQTIYGRRAGATMPPTRATTTARRRTTRYPTTTRRPARTTTTTRRPGVSDRDRFCSWNSFDAIDMIGGMTYAFKHELYVMLDVNGIRSGYPRRIADDFEGAPSDIDAVLNWEADDKTFLFKGTKYWRYSSTRTGFRLADGYPRFIRDGFTGIPDDIDFAMVWGANGKTYFFKGDKYFRYERQRGVPSYYPRSSDLWDGLPFKGEGVTAAFKWRDMKTYFFSGNSYYAFDDWNFEVDTSDDPPYPRPLASWWLNCPDKLTDQMAMKHEHTALKQVAGTGHLDKDAAMATRFNSVTIAFGFVLILLVNI